MVGPRQVDVPAAPGVTPAAEVAARLDRHGHPKPRWRGRIHRAAFVAAIPAGVVLVLAGSTMREWIACAIYAATLVGLFGVSSAYHLGDHPEPRRTMWRRADHAMIFVLIAGTYTPFTLLVLEGTWATVLLAVVWGGAVIGVAITMWRVELKVVPAVMYLGLGWAVILAFPAIARGLDTLETALLVAGGVIYSLGALALATHWPGPLARSFGYHEVFHALTVAAAACQYAVILRVVVA